MRRAVSAGARSPAVTSLFDEFESAALAAGYVRASVPGVPSAIPLAELRSYTRGSVVLLVTAVSIGREPGVFATVWTPPPTVATEAAPPA